MKLLTDINDRLNDMAAECAFPRLWKITVLACMVAFAALTIAGAYLSNTL